MSVQSIVASEWMLGLVLTGVLLVVAARNRAYLKELETDHDRGWQALRRATVLVVFGAIAWISLADSWRQLTSLPFRATRRWDYQRVEIDPVNPTVRAMTVGLVAIVAILVACLVARYVTGVVIQAIVAAGAFFAWLPFFILRQRFNIDLAMGFGGDSRSPVDIAGYVVFVIGAWAFEIGLILVLFTGIVALVSIPVTLVLDLCRLRRPRVSHEADDFFSSIGTRRHA